MLATQSCCSAFPIAALGDIKHGRVKWFVFGLMESEGFAQRKHSLASKGVELVAGGCVIGGTDYEASMAYNQKVSERYPFLRRPG